MQRKHSARTASGFRRLRAEGKCAGAHSHCLAGWLAGWLTPLPACLQMFPENEAGSGDEEGLEHGDDEEGEEEGLEEEIGETQVPWV